MAALIVHGGAGTVPDALVEASVEGCRLAAEKAYKLLESGNSALDAGKVVVSYSWIFTSSILQLRQL